MFLLSIFFPIIFLIFISSFVKLDFFFFLRQAKKGLKRKKTVILGEILARMCTLILIKPRPLQLCCNKIIAVEIYT